MRSYSKVAREYRSVKVRRVLTAAATALVKVISFVIIAAITVVMMR
jgi:hypothetical protein